MILILIETRAKRWADVGKVSNTKSNVRPSNNVVTVRHQYSVSAEHSHETPSALHFTYLLK